MSINNIDGINPGNTHQPNRILFEETAPQDSSNMDSPASVPNSAYGQYLVNYNSISASRVNDNEADMEQIYELDKEIYGEYSSYDSFDDFKHFISSNGLSTYALKDRNNNIIGYYNLEPINNGELYIDSMGLKPEHRNSAKGDCAINAAWNKILEYAMDNEVETLSLHVDSSDTEQVELYQQLGFQIAETLPNYWGAEQNAYFMKFSVQNNSNLVQEPDDINVPVNNNEEEMREIYAIDSEAFAEQDPFDSYEDYKEYIDEHQISVYSVKDENELLGYYAIEPVKDGDMYIYSVALKPEYRNTRKGYKTIQESWGKILDEAKKQGATTLSLHVDAENPKLKKLYERFGFNVTKTVSSFYDNGHDALYMVKNLADRDTSEGEVVSDESSPQADITLSDNDSSQEEAGQALPDNNPVEQSNPVTTFTPTAEEIYNEKVQKAEERLEELQIEERTGFSPKNIIEESSYTYKNEKVFDEDMFDVAVQIAELYKNEENDYWKRTSLKETMKALEEDNGSGRKTIRKDVLPYIERFCSLGVEPKDIDKILSRTKINSKISTTELDKVVHFVEGMPNNQKRRVADAMGYCKLEDKNGRSFLSTEMMDDYNRYMSLYDDYFDFEDISKASVTRNEDGSEYFNRDTFRMLERHFSTNGTYLHPSGLYAERILSQVHNQDITLDFYMEKFPLIKDDNVFKETLRKYNKAADVGSKKDNGTDPDIVNTAAMLKAISYRTYEENTDYMTGKKYTVPTDHFDYNARDVLRDYCEKGIPFDNIMNFAHAMSACKEKPHAYLPEEFSPELLEKAIQLKETGLDEKYIPEIMEACKFEETDYFGQKTRRFNDDMFRHVVLKCQQDVKKVTPAKVKMSKDFVDGKEVFRSDVLDLLAENNVPEEESRYSGGLSDFQIKYPNENKSFSKSLFQAWKDAHYPEVRLISDEYNDIYTPNRKAMVAYKTLKERCREENWGYTPQNGGERDPVLVLMYACQDTYKYTERRWNNQVYEHIIDLKDKGYSVNEIVDLMYNCREWLDNGTIDSKDNLFMEEKYQYAMSLLEQGVDITNAGKIANASMTEGKMTNPDTDKMIELYNLGSNDPVKDIFNCKDTTTNEVNDIAYERMKDVLSRGLEPALIPACRNKGIFSDRLYHLALDLQKRGYSPSDVTTLMESCHLKEIDESTGNVENCFKQNIYDHIKDLENIGINQDNILTVLGSCKYNKTFSEEAFSKVSELHNKGYDDKGISKFLKNCSQHNKFVESIYDDILELSKKHTDLRDSVHGDDYILDKLFENELSVKRLKNVYGEDVNNYAISMKIDGYINFANQCSNLLEKYDSNFNNDLQARLNELPSPEQKVKRLRILGGLSYHVAQNALIPLVRLIKSPKMTEAQIELANRIFTPVVNNEDYPEDMPKQEIELKDYEKRVDKFLDEIKVPTQYRQTVRDFLMKERLDKSIERPKSIEEQKAQMEKNAQQMLINPKIPLDKKITYIDEYKEKIKDMEVNPDKYLTPYIYPKPMEKLKKVVEAYVNVPNDDTRFNNTIKESMYAGMEIETTPELLGAINYDSKFFDKMFAVQNDFKTNFKTLIELKKMNMGKSLREARLTLPEAGTEKYEQYQRLGLIEQINANLDTKRQIEEHRLNYDKWDSFDDNLRGETFTSEADPETEYKNLKYNVINIFQDELWNSIKSEETQKLTDYLEKNGFKIFNNNLYKNGKEATNPDIEKFINDTVNYISNDKYWKEVNVNSDLPSEEIAGVTGFTDHIKGFQKRAEEIKNARTVSNIHFRLTDDDNIGRNIFFGNHVGCCNSVESTHAGYSAPMHLLNNYNRGIELVDEWENSYGNSLCYFADVDDKLTFVIDSFEANGKLGSNPLVAEKLFEFAKQVCAEMGRPDAQIMVGPNYNQMDKSLLTETRGHKIKVLGTVSGKTYCDSVGGIVKDEINRVVENRSMLELTNSQNIL